jgi:hypothetical protein
VGAAFTVKQLLHEPLPASGFVTVTFPAPVVAPAETVMLAVSEVDDTKVVEFTVIPDPENVAAAPLTNPVPAIVIDWLEVPCPREDGLVELTVGPAFTAKHPLHEPLPESGLVTVTFPAPVVAPAETVMLAVSEVEDTKVVEFTVIPLAENVAAAPLTNPVPVIVMFWLLAP